MKGLKDLYVFFSYIKDAPGDISILSAEILCVKMVRTNLRAHIKHMVFEPYNIGLESALNDWNKAVKGLETLGQRYYPSSDKKSLTRYWRQMIVAFKKENSRNTLRIWNERKPVF